MISVGRGVGDLSSCEREEDEEYCPNQFTYDRDHMASCPGWECLKDFSENMLEGIGGGYFGVAVVDIHGDAAVAVCELRSHGDAE